MKRILLFTFLAILLGAGLFLRTGWHDDDQPASAVATAANTTEQIARGAYLARAGDCMACHTVRGGQAYAGGRSIATPFGAIMTPNLTPDAETGIGKWSAADFWGALHNGKSKDGRLLYPAFPYPNYTKVTRADSDAMYAYFRTVTPVRQANRPHTLRFPYDTQAALGAWRALYFKPGVYQPEGGRSVEWNRGAYMVQGLGHCSACHTSRNALGATDSGADLAGGLIPVTNWYAPSLTSDAETGLGSWDQKHIADLLKTGVSPRGAVFGPMAEVVYASLQHLTDSDVGAMAGYLKTLPQSVAPEQEEPGISKAQIDRLMVQGGKLYETQCMDCHGARGEGTALAYPPLAGNRAITMPSSVNAIRIVLHGGFPPGTTGNPRPYGMPPYGPSLDDAEVAAVVSFIRGSWGNKAGPVSATEVNQARTGTESGFD